MVKKQKKNKTQKTQGFLCLGFFFGLGFLGVFFLLPTQVTTRHRTANLCSLKEKIGEPAGTNIRAIIIYIYNSLVKFG